MQHDPRPAIHEEKQSVWADKLRGEESLEIFREEQTVLPRSSLRYGTTLLALWLFGGRVQKRDNGFCHTFYLEESCHLDDRHFSSSPYTICVPLKLLPQCWSLEGMSLSKSVCGFFKKNCLGLQNCHPPAESPLLFGARSYGDLSS